MRNIKIEQAVKTETKHIATGVGGMTVVLLLVFLVLGRFDYTVLLGALLGAGFAVLNFFLMAMAVQRSVTQGDPAKAKKITQSSYTKRLLLLAAVLVVGIKVPYFNWITTIVPLFFPRITIFIMTLPIFQRKGEE
ncbi:MAG: ATP synthase subunit I [Eubacteriales bacterium]|nr:ATP synthase subunit I [Eubacteriales bacterium]